MCELASYSASGYPKRVEHTHCRMVNSKFKGWIWVANFINDHNSSTESALDPPYGEIQESYLTYYDNAMQVLYNRECSWLILWQVQDSLASFY